MAVIGRQKRLTQECLHNGGFFSGKLMVYPSQNRIVVDGQEKVLQPKVMELLVLLCAARGETVTKETLIASLWPQVRVGPDSLANTMARLRRAIGDNAKQPDYIETVQSKGYRWLQAVVLEKSAFKPTQVNLVFFSLILLICLLVAGVSLFLPSDKAKEHHTFPYTDLYIETTEDGLVVEVGIEGELTEEKKAKMLEDIKRITGQENTGMQFTLDDPDVCQQTAGTKAQPVHCQSKGKRAQQD